jgi:hypothetical protein
MYAETYQLLHIFNGVIIQAPTLERWGSFQSDELGS